MIEDNFLPPKSRPGTPAVKNLTLTQTLTSFRPRNLKYNFFEGIVIKRADSHYPVQLRSATEEFRGWCKHRFLA